MKKRMILAASFMAAVALTSCSNNDFVEEPVGSAELVEIQVGQEVEGIETKAAINTGDQVEAIIIATNGDKPADWGTFVPVTENTFTTGGAWSPTTFANVATGTFEAGASKAVGLNPTLYANPEEESGGATLTGVAPKGTVTAGKVAFAVHDGQQDVMVAPTTTKKSVVGGNMSAFALKFEHKTAQLRVIMSAVNNAGTGAWTPSAEILVKKITVKNTNVPIAVSLNDMTVEWTKTAADIHLDNLNSKIPMTFGTQTSLKPDTVLVEKVAMVKPGVPVKLTVLLTINGEEKMYPDIVPTKVGGGVLTTVEAKYHNIRLRVKQPAKPTGTPIITATASVTEWGVGDEGEFEL